MITRLSPQEPVLVLNFEEPEEVIQRSQAEIARRREASDQSSAQSAENGQGAVDGSAPRQARGPQESDPATPR